MKGEKGFSFIEVVIALALLGIIAAAFLGGLGAASKGTFTADERETANNLAVSQMEEIKNQPYAASYTIPVPAEYTDAGYSTVISVEPLSDGNIQKITVTVSHDARPEIIILEDYKVK